MNRKKYIAPTSENIKLYTEAAVAVGLGSPQNSEGQSNSLYYSEILSNKKDDNSIWGNSHDIWGNEDE